MYLDMLLSITVSNILSAMFAQSIVNKSSKYFTIILYLMLVRYNKSLYFPLYKVGFSNLRGFLNDLFRS